MTTQLGDGLCESALQVVQALLPESSSAVAIQCASTIAWLGTVGPHATLLRSETAQDEVRHTLEERRARTVVCDGDLLLTSLPLPQREREVAGVLQLVAPVAPDHQQQHILEAIVQVARDMIGQSTLNKDLQHSLNQLFLVHQVGREFTLSTSLEAVLAQMRDQLGSTLNLHYCCILLLREQRQLEPVAGLGIDRLWAQEERPALTRSLGRSVLESGAAEQVTDPHELRELDLPSLDDGLRPAGVLCAPLSTRTGVIGFLEVYTPFPYAFSADEVFLVSILAAEVAMAVENTQLYESLREKEGRLTVLAHRLIHSQEEERRRIARDMHDGLAQMIVSAFQLLQAHAFTVQSGADRHALDRGLAMLTECIDESRKVIFDLRPSTLDDFGLVSALHQYLQMLGTEQHWDVEFAAKGTTEALSPALETAIFRLVQEALTNVRKHAQAGRVRVRLTARHHAVMISVRDWGSGFEPRHVAGQRGHLGLAGMRERVALLNGTIAVHSRPGTGTLICITIPTD
jgi:signal transduction histidine kinase